MPTGSENPDSAGVPVLYDMHMHTPLCKHARGEPEAYAAVAQQRGLKGIIFTCHNPADDGWSPGVRMSIDEFDTYIDMVARARAAWEGKVDIRLGLECDFIPGMEPWLEKLLQMGDFHYVLGSIHPQIRDYKARFDVGDHAAFQKTYFEHLALAAETGLFDTLSHPDLIKNLAPDDWDAERMMDIILPCLDRIATTDTAMELNTSGLNKALPEFNPGALMLEKMRERGIPVVIGSDAHDPHRVGADFEKAFDALEAAGYTHTAIALDRKRNLISLERARNSISGPAN